jgi:hypothetical protein
MKPQTRGRDATRKNPLLPALRWFLWQGLRNAYELWRFCGIGLWSSVRIEWEIARMWTGRISVQADPAELAEISNLKSSTVNRQSSIPDREAPPEP